jgi:2-keto-4-pentenoate hydratase
MTTSEAATFLIGLWREQKRCIEMPEHLRPVTRNDAYRIQALMEQQSSFPLYGWKIAATSIAGQKHIGVNGPLAGRYVAERVVHSGASIPFGKNHMAVAEVEFAFRLGADLPPRDHPYTEQEVFATVASLHPAIEIPDSRYDRFETVGAPQLIADNACAHWLAVGDAAPEKWRTLDLATFQPVGRITGKSDVQGNGSNVLGSPRIAMTWLVNELSVMGITAKSGQTVTTGTCLVPMAVAAGDHIEGDFGELGKIAVTLT